MRGPLVLALLVGCGNGSLCPAEHVTIEQGVFGATYATGDVGDDIGPAPSAGFVVEVLGGDGEVVGMATSDGDGFYELALPGGDYHVCAVADRCTTFSIGEHVLVRMDHRGGLLSDYAIVDPATCKEWKDLN